MAFMEQNGCRLSYGDTGGNVLDGRPQNLGPGE